MPAQERYRAISWWIVWKDLSWPDHDVLDTIKRRSDEAAEAGVNAAVIFGAHFRWDMMPLWDRVHDYIATVREHVHERGIKLFDHYSAVLTHRPRNRDEDWDIRNRNRHHVPLYPGRREAALLTFNGTRLNDWRVIDVHTREPAFMPAYTCEQFCMNNPDFQAAYQAYLKRLVDETGIDGLMSDDGIYYHGWHACACEHCLKRFRDEYGHELPPTDDLSFWGNRESEAFKDWITLRFHTVRDFMKVAQDAVPAGMPLMTCCSSSDAQHATRVAMTYEDFIQHSNLVMLEMCGSTPMLDGRWDARIPSQLLHLGIANEQAVDCIGLGYGYFEDSGFFVWAVNKFLGSDTWFSTLRGRLGLPDSRIDWLPDDPQLVGEGFRWERDHPDLFPRECDAQVAVLYSRETRDYYGQTHADYVADYHATCFELFRDHVDFDVVTHVPAPGDYPVLLLSSVTCLTAAERGALDAFVRGGGTVVATGPTGVRRERAAFADTPWLEQFGIRCDVTEPDRAPAFPPDSGLTNTAATVAGSLDGQPLDAAEWAEAGDGAVLWRAARAHGTPGVAAATRERLETRPVEMTGCPEGWYTRRFRDGGRIVIHALPSQVGVSEHDTLHDQFRNAPVLHTIDYGEGPGGSLDLAFTETPKAVTLHSPDLDAPRRVAVEPGATTHQVELGGVKRYFVVEIET